MHSSLSHLLNGFHYFISHLFHLFALFSFSSPPCFSTFHFSSAQSYSSTLLFLISYMFFTLLFLIFFIFLPLLLISKICSLFYFSSSSSIFSFSSPQSFSILFSSSRAGTRQFFSFATTTMRQGDNVYNIASGTSQGPGKNWNIVRPQCLNGVATINIVKWQLQTTLWP